jgi:hypothetical protein
MFPKKQVVPPNNVKVNVFNLNHKVKNSDSSKGSLSLVEVGRIMEKMNQRFSVHQ